MPYRHIIWDWNGTLLDDAWLCVECMNQLLNRRQMPLLTLEKYARVFDFPVRDYYERLGFDFAVEPFEDSGLEFIREYHARLYKAGLRKNAAKVLSQIQEMGVKQSVLSAQEQDSLRSLIRHHGIDSYFEEIIGLNHHYADGKLDNGRRWLESTGVLPTDVLLVGDTIHDYEVACDLGFNCLLMTGGHQDPARLNKTGIPLITTLDSVRDVVEKSLSGQSTDLNNK